MIPCGVALSKVRQKIKQEERIIEPFCQVRRQAAKKNVCQLKKERRIEVGCGREDWKLSIAQV